MNDITLFAAPGSCSRVTAIALNQANLGFDLQLMRFKIGEHRSPSYLVKNPKGKVPALAIHGAVLTENVAILTYLDKCFPEAMLLPKATDQITEARHLADLCFCSATLHPIVTRIRIPSMFVAGDGPVRSVYDHAIKAMQPNFALIEARLSEGPWWYGREWSVMDGYLFWIWFRVTGAGMDIAAFPNLARHADQMSRLPCVEKTLSQEHDMEAQLEREGMTMILSKPPVQP